MDCCETGILKDHSAPNKSNFNYTNCNLKCTHIQRSNFPTSTYASILVGIQSKATDYPLKNFSLIFPICSQCCANALTPVQPCSEGSLRFSHLWYNTKQAFEILDYWKRFMKILGIITSWMLSTFHINSVERPCRSLQLFNYLLIINSFLEAHRQDSK